MASSSDSDFEEGCDYTDQELKQIIDPRSPSKQHLHDQKSPPKKKKTKKKISSPHLETLSPSPSQKVPIE